MRVQLPHNLVRKRGKQLGNVRSEGAVPPKLMQQMSCDLKSGAKLGRIAPKCTHLATVALCPRLEAYINGVCL